MKIVQVCRLYVPHIGGVETHVSEVSRRLVEAGHSVVVLTWQHKADLPLTEVIDGVTVIRKPFEIGEKKLGTWRWILSQRSVLTQANIIQVHDVFWWLLPLLPLIKAKIFTTFHGWETQYPVPSRAQLQRWLWNKLSKGTVHVGDWIKEFYWDTPTFVTYGGITIEKYAPQPIKRSKKMQLVFLGRLSAENEISKYLQLIKVLKKQNHDIEMVWVGDGDLADQCRQVGTVTGLVADTEKYLASADFVFANSYLSILQAQAQGKVVCAFYSNTLKKRYLQTYPGQSGLVLTDSVKTMTQEIENILADKPQRKLLEQSSVVFARQQTWEKVVIMYLDLWRK